MFRRVMLGLLIVLLTSGGVAAYWYWLRERPLPEGLLQTNGRIEGDHVAVASEYAGRIAKLLVREGDSVTRGQTIIQLEDDEIRARVEQAREAVDALRARLEAERTSLDLLEEEVPLAISVAQTRLEQARQDAESAQSKALQAERDVKRYRQLAEERAVSQEDLENILLQQKVVRNELEAAEAAVKAAEKKKSEAELRRKEIVALRERIDALEAERQKAVARQQEAESILQDLTIVAPIGGEVTERLVEVGEVVQAGAPLLDLVNLDRLYLKAYVPEDQIGKIRRELPARIHIDAYPDRCFPATLRYIASDAEFTPKEVQTPEQRVKLVYAVKLYLDENPDHRLTPGLPADAVIRWKDGVPWAEPR